MTDDDSGADYDDDDDDDDDGGDDDDDFCGAFYKNAHIYMKTTTKFVNL